MDVDFLIKRMVLEQACYFCQHSVIQRILDDTLPTFGDSFMPDDITTYGLHPVLPAMAALHNIVSSYHSDHESGKAVTLLKYIHSLISDPSPQLQEDYVDILISLKSKAVFYEVFTSDYSCGDERQCMDILDKYFGEDCESSSTCDGSLEDSYSVENHKSVRLAIKGLLESKTKRKEFQTNVLLQSVKSKGLYDGLADNMEIYLNNVRKMLPTPQLIVDYINFKASSESGDDDDDCAEYTESKGFHRHLPSSSSPSPGRKDRVRVALKKPRIHLTKLPLQRDLYSPSASDCDERTATDSQNDDTSDFDDMREWQSPATPRGYKTPAVPQMGMEIKKLGPKETRVMGSIARKRKFLTGSPTTSSDDSSCSFLSLKKLHNARPSFVSPEIPLATRRTSFQQKHEICKNRDCFVVQEPPQSSSTNVRSVINRRSNLSSFHMGCKMDAHSSRTNVIVASSPSPETKTSGVVRRVHRRNPRKRAMVHFELESDFVSDSDSESPLLKPSPLHGLSETLHKIC